MPSALEIFQAQRDAAEQVHVRVKEIGALLERLRHETDALAQNRDLRAVLQQEQRWLERAELTIAEVRTWREQEARKFWPGVLQRWLIATIFAWVSAAASSAGYAWVTKPYASELEALRARMDFAEFVERRVIAMTAAERRQFDALMKPAPSKP